MNEITPEMMEALTKAKEAEDAFLPGGGSRTIKLPIRMATHIPLIVHGSKSSKPKRHMRKAKVDDTIPLWPERCSYLVG